MMPSGEATRQTEDRSRWCSWNVVRQIETILQKQRTKAGCGDSRSEMKGSANDSPEPGKCRPAGSDEPGIPTQVGF